MQPTTEGVNIIIFNYRTSFNNNNSNNDCGPNNPINNKPTQIFNSTIDNRGANDFRQIYAANHYLNNNERAQYIYADYYRGNHNGSIYRSQGNADYSRNNIPSNLDTSLYNTAANHRTDRNSNYRSFNTTAHNRRRHNKATKYSDDHRSIYGRRTKFLTNRFEYTSNHYNQRNNPSINNAANNRRNLDNIDSTIIDKTNNDFATDFIHYT
ncbi:Hypp7041 [Branchiostoma lanceolatum]|uniref:Hypp7041 protein n=1 Tax=Branchiostoma lanceolatum TaxID=7740 RepID=A0A8J9YWL9_BRALA|nr:Hypp7041 [Branchiostoma lanceolatum]